MSSSESALQELRQKAGGAIVALLVIAGLIWGFSQSIGMPVELRPFATGFVLLAAMSIGLSFYTDKSGEFVVTFGIIGITLLLFILSLGQGFGLIPDWFIALLASVVDPGLELIGTDTTLADLLGDAGSLFILFTIGSAIAIGVAFRLKGEAKSLDVIADRTFERLARYAETYLSIGRLFVFFLVTLGSLFLLAAAQLAGQVGDIFGQFPIISAYFATLVAGFDSLGGEVPYIGELPIIGDLGPPEFAILGIVLLLLAVSQSRTGSGSLSQFIRGRIE